MPHATKHCTVAIIAISALCMCITNAKKYLDESNNVISDTPDDLLGTWCAAHSQHSNPISCFQNISNELSKFTKQILWWVKFFWIWLCVTFEKKICAFDRVVLASSIASGMWWEETDGAGQKTNTPSRQVFGCTVVMSSAIIKGRDFKSMRC